MLNLLDEFTRERLAIRIERRFRSTDVIDVLSDLFILHGVPDHIRSDNSPEIIAKVVRFAIPPDRRQHRRKCPDIAGQAGSLLVIRSGKLVSEELV